MISGDFALVGTFMAGSLAGSGAVPAPGVFLGDGIMIELLTSWTGVPAGRGISVSPV
jgi:hypothetical protein